MKAVMLGTGHAVVTNCYNTCYVIDAEGKQLLVDGGGGITLLKQMKAAGIRWKGIREIFVTHRHLDHIGGIFWMMRMILGAMRSGKLKEDVFLYSHDEVISILRHMTGMLLPESVSFLDTRLHLITVGDGEEREVIGARAKFFDIGSRKAKQFGMVLEQDGRRIVICGDEPLAESCERFAEGADWLFHEAFCLYADADRYSPYEKHHSTVKDACETAERLHVKNLLLYHTEDSDMRSRKRRYTEEGARYFGGSLYVPDDLEEIVLF